MNKSEVAERALSNAVRSASMSNYPEIFNGFMERGIPEWDIKPRENVFTYHAWLALGRQVRRGEHGVRVITWIPMSKKQSDGTTKDVGRRPKTTTVFHISQTDEIAK